MPASLHIIAAMDHNRLIGNNNELPWKLSADLQRFKQITMGKPILMGRKTWESLGRPLPGRQNIVITRNTDYIADGATVVHTIKQGLEVAGDGIVMCIGGAEIYKQALPLTEHLYITRVLGQFEGDTWFPNIDRDDWSLESVEHHEPDEKNDYYYVYEQYTRS